MHVQHVAIPCRNERVAVNMWTNILLKRCVLTNVANYNHIPCFGYALILAINRLYTDFTGVQYLAANVNRMINEVSADGTSVFIEGTNYDKVINIVNNELERINIWLRANKLTVNIKKTYYM